MHEPKKDYENSKLLELPVPAVLSRGGKYILKIKERDLLRMYRLHSQPCEDTLTILSEKFRGVSGFILSEFHSIRDLYQ